MKRRRRCSFAALACLTLVVGCGRAHAPAPPAPRLGDFVGIYADDVFFGDDTYRRQALARQREAGIGLIRQPFAWSDFAQNQARYDAFVGAAASQGIRVLPVLVGPQPNAPRATGGMTPPSDPAAFARYAAALVERYGPGGSFWSGHPDIRPLPIHAWQVWNEPNIPAFWAGGPDPAAYARLLEATSAAIRKADPNAEVVSAGLPTSHMGIPADKFLEGLYRDGAKGSFDTVAIHAYASTPQGVVEHARNAHDVISRNSDDAKLWITEFGWGTGGEPGPLTVSREQQADYIAKALRALEANRSALDLRGAILFQWRDPKPFPGRRRIWPYYAGLIDNQGNPKPSLGALERAETRIGAA